ncbi:MAG: hypothetical protein KDN19_20080, partial [Verrucomicrobiae bacterium]|nr:hypothetical protein [Verrucomicrobiae bacterium]
MGSTAFKNSSPTSLRWIRAFYGFYSDLPATLKREYEATPKIAPPEVWKTLGDEIVFVAPLANHQDAAIHVRRFINAVRSYRHDLKRSVPQLDLKSAVWVAGFPVGNTAVQLHKKYPLANGGATDEGMIAVAVEDFIGPQMDIGFRLCHAASPRKLLVSVELAYLLASGEPSGVEFYLDKGEPLKGVLSEKPYPMIWVDMFGSSPDDGHDELAVLEDELRMVERTPCRHEKLTYYCRLFIESAGAPLAIPFIDGDDRFEERPEGYKENMAEIRKVWESLPDTIAEPEPEREGDQSDVNAFLEKFRRFMDLDDETKKL